jgi:hypothetical protein
MVFIFVAQLIQINTILTDHKIAFFKSFLIPAEAWTLVWLIV